MAEAIVLATRNKGKIAELTSLLEDFGHEVRGLDDYPDIPEIEETGETFEENARLKARTVSQATGLVAVADDSGLEVDALGGAPGVRSSRFSGEDATDTSNNEKLLAELEDVEEEDRAARFVCTMVAMSPSGESISARGTWEGRIARTPAGKNGFGYDPLFFDPELGCTAAQLESDVKNKRSHRGTALGRLLEKWPDFRQRIESKE